MSTTIQNRLSAYVVSVKGTDWSKVVNARSPGKAKRDYHLDVIDAFPGVPYTLMRCRKVGGPITSTQFERNARYRGMPEVRCGQRVSVGCGRGVIVGHNASANFDVLFDEDSPRYAGMKLNVHPGDVILAESTTEQTDSKGPARRAIPTLGNDAQARKGQTLTEGGR